MELLITITLAILNLLALFLIALGLPGTWLMVALTGAAAWLKWDAEAPFISKWTLVAMASLAVVGELLEFVAGAAGSKKAGGTWRGAVGAVVLGLVGGILGTFLIPVPLVGSLLGAAAGAFVGASVGEISGGKSLEPALAVGRGAFTGRLLGAGWKLAVGAAMWCVALGACLFG